MPMVMDYFISDYHGAVKLGRPYNQVKVQTLEYVKFVLYILVIGGLKYRATTLWRWLSF